MTQEGVFILIIILTVAAITFVLRLIPFVVMKRLSENNYLRYIGSKMPVGIMVLLLFYTFIDLDFMVPPYGISHILSSLIALGVYWFRGNALLAIGLGLGFHVIVVNAHLF